MKKSFLTPLALTPEATFNPAKVIVMEDYENKQCRNPTVYRNYSINLTARPPPINSNSSSDISSSTFCFLL
jgi:hypothetical protein